jgi:hypothetical protein
MNSAGSRVVTFCLFACAEMVPTELDRVRILLVSAREMCTERTSHVEIDGLNVLAKLS